jgi:hypothetical protein
VCHQSLPVGVAVSPSEYPTFRALG